MYVGTAWASKGWLAVRYEGGGWTATMFPSICGLWSEDSSAERILIDCPIGLPTISSGKRECDREAKELLSDRHQSVFYTPTREAIYATNLEEAKEVNQRAGFGIETSAWAYIRQIREVDQFFEMHPGARDRLTESRAELCFQAFTDGDLEYSKHTEAGRKERKRILVNTHPEIKEFLETIISYPVARSKLIHRTTQSDLNLTQQ